jgi:hypothetical protein
MNESVIINNNGSLSSMVASNRGKYDEVMKGKMVIKKDYIKELMAIEQLNKSFDDNDH